MKFEVESSLMALMCDVLKCVMHHQTSCLNATLQINILHMNLSASNILVADSMVCKLTGFASADDVKARQRLLIESDVSDVIRRRCALSLLDCATVEC